MEEHLDQAVSSDIKDEQKELVAAWKSRVLGNARFLSLDDHRDQGLFREAGLAVIHGFRNAESAGR